MKTKNKIISFLIVCIAVGCNSNLSQEKDCGIKDFKDKSIKGKNNTTRLDFYCDSSEVISSSYDLIQNNPYREIGFPIITKSTEYYKVGRNYNDLRKTGNIDFNLEGESFTVIDERIPHKLPNELGKYDFELAITRCGVKIISRKQAIVNYYISLYGYMNERKEGGVIFLGGRLYILNEMGNKDYEILADNFAITYPEIIPEGILTFRTTEMIENKSKDGFQIHDLKSDSLLFNFEFDITQIVKEPIYSKNKYIIFQVLENNSSLKELFLYDLEANQIYKKTFYDSYEFRYSKIDGRNIILNKSVFEEGGDEFLYDTLKIIDLIKDDL